MAKNESLNNGRENKPRVSTQQKKIHRQQLLLAVVGIILILTMVLSLVMTY